MNSLLAPHRPKRRLWKNPTVGHLVSVLGLAVFGGYAGAAPIHAASDRPSILFIGIDDLRPDLGCYGATEIQSPNLDRLAERGTRFASAYCTQALCAPSRASLLSGQLPTSNGLNARNSMDTDFHHQRLTELRTLPQILGENGYRTLTIGKIFHNYKAEDDDAWTRQLTPNWDNYQSPKNLSVERKFAEGRRAGKKAWQLSRGPAAESANVPEEDYQDASVARGAIQLLRESAKNPDQPFFLAVGFYKPHLPFVAPQRYWDLYDRDEIVVPSPDHPEGMPDASLPGDFYELRPYGDIPRKGPVDEAKAKELIHGYRACISFVDAQIGRVLDELVALGLDKTTLVIVWSDHGYKLGEYGQWSKLTNLELDTHIPMFVAGPGIDAGAVRQSPVELIDLFPTVLDVAGIEIPEITQGRSIRPLFTADSPIREAAFSVFDREKPDAQGISVRTSDYRYTEWRDYETGKLVARELYDHTTSPLAERNLVEDPDFSAVVESHAKLIADDLRFANLPRAAGE